MNNNCPQHEIEIPETKCQEFVVVPDPKFTMIRQINDRFVVIQYELPTMNKVVRELDISEKVLTKLDPYIPEPKIKPPKKNFVNKFNKNQHRK